MNKLETSKAIAKELLAKLKNPERWSLSEIDSCDIHAELDCDGESYYVEVPNSRSSRLELDDDTFSNFIIRDASSEWYVSFYDIDEAAKYMDELMSQDEDEEIKYLILSKKRSDDIATWYRPNSCGYTQNIGEAGRFGEEAVEWAESSHGNLVAIEEGGLEKMRKRVVVDMEEVNQNGSK